MKIKNISLVCILLISFITKAQVGIGTISPNALLDVFTSTPGSPANTDGLLVPRIDIFPTTDPTIAQKGMLVYLKTSATYASILRSPGFFYWDGTTWLGVQNSTIVNWNFFGNTGTNSATNFFGTTDDKDIVFRRNNIRAGFIGNPNTSSGNMNTSFGANSLLNPSATGIRNVAIGTNVLPINSTGFMNVSIGDQSMFSNTIGTGNAAVGVGALYSNSIGINNVAFGRNALVSANASYNTAIGFASLRQNASGTNNSALGYQSGYTASGNNNVFLGVNAGYSSTGSNNLFSGYSAGYSSTGSNNIFIGNQAGYNETGSDKLYIENATLSTDSSQYNALIYGDSGSTPKILRTNAQLQIGNPTTTGYVFPTSRGTLNQVLQTNASGVVSWVAPSALSITEVDPKVASTTTNSIPKWNGTTLVNGILTDDGTNVGVGSSPSVGNKLDVNGKTKTTNLQITNGATSNYFLQSDASGNGSWAAIPVNTILPFSTTGASTGTYTVSLSEYTIRVYNDVSEVMLPNAVGNIGKIYIIIGSNGISSKILSTAGGGIYDDVTNASITNIAANQRLMVQSDGTGWIVIGR